MILHRDPIFLLILPFNEAMNHFFLRVIILGCTCKILRQGVKISAHTHDSERASRLISKYWAHMIIQHWEPLVLELKKNDFIENWKNHFLNPEQNWSHQKTHFSFKNSFFQRLIFVIRYFRSLIFELAKSRVFNKFPKQLST